MPIQPYSIEPLHVTVALAVFSITVYLYQIASRKREWLRYKIRLALVGELFMFGAAYVLSQQRLPNGEVVLISVLVGFGCACLFVRPPRRSRRYSKKLREQVIARDLKSKGLKWDRKKYQIDHIVPFARKGDHSLRNLRVIAKERNLRKGAKMPGLLDFFRK